MNNVEHAPYGKLPPNAVPLSHSYRLVVVMLSEQLTKIPHKLLATTPTRTHHQQTTEVTLLDMTITQFFLNFSSINLHKINQSKLLYTCCITHLICKYLHTHVL